MAGAIIPKMRLWYCSVYRSTRCAWIIKELGLDDKVEFKYVPINLGPPSPEREEYRKNVHPHSTVPALEIEGRPVMLESAAICMYLAELRGRLLPELTDKDEYYNWIMYGASRMDEALMALTVQWLFTPKKKQNAEIIAHHKAILDVCLDRVENNLKTRQYFLGDKLTTADCVTGYNLLWASVPELNNGILVKERPNIQSYLDRINARPALQAALTLPSE